MEVVLDEDEAAYVPFVSGWSLADAALVIALVGLSNVPRCVLFAQEELTVPVVGALGVLTTVLLAAVLPPVLQHVHVSVRRVFVASVLGAGMLSIATDVVVHWNRAIDSWHFLEFVGHGMTTASLGLGVCVGAVLLVVRHRVLLVVAVLLPLLFTAWGFASSVRSLRADMDRPAPSGGGWVLRPGC